MTRRAIIVHGKPSKEDYYNPSLPSNSNSLWLPWLQQQLLQRDIATQTPEMLRAYQPDYAIWKETLERLRPGEDTLLIGHSCGGGFLVQWLSEHPDVSVGHVFLVAPAFGDSLAPPEAKYDLPLLNGFFDFTPDPALLNRLAGLHLIHSDNDNIRVDTTVELLQKTYPEMSSHLFAGRGHFVSDGDGKRLTALPELLQIIDDSLQ